MTDPRAAVVCMSEIGHLRRVLPVIRGLAALGTAPDVWTDRRFRAEVEHAGGRFFDVYGGRSLDAVDSTSIPRSSRYVSFAGRYVDSLVAEVGGRRPDVLIYDTFAVVAPLVARRLRIPYVNVCFGHDAAPARMTHAFATEVALVTSEACRDAVRRLRDEFGVTDASPLSFCSALSPHLNVYCEPEEFLPVESRAVFEPVAFLGSLSPAPADLARRTRSEPARDVTRRVYVSFGTIVWRHFAEVAVAALATISRALAERAGVEVVISLGGAPIRGAQLAGLARANVRVLSYVDQWQVLREADVFFTHHGLNSTHEAIFREVPMISYPFFVDQPGLARRCAELGLALPLVEEPRAEVTSDDVERALASLSDDRAGFADRLERARGWELAAIAARPRVIERILSLAGRAV